MKKLTVVGLGHESGEVTLNGLGKIRLADKVVVKTAQTSATDILNEQNIDYISCDSLFDEAQDFLELDQKITEFILAQKEENLVFCVNGDGFSDSAVKALSKIMEIEIVPGVAQSGNILRFCPQSGYQTFSCFEFLDVLQISNNIPLVVTEIDDKLMAMQLKEKLCAFYDEEMSALLFNQKAAKKIALYELDREKKYNENTTLLLLPENLLCKNNYEISDLKQILAMLRGENGCPWDKAQTHVSLRANVIEEAYELVDAIDSGETEKIVEETGDNLLQVFFHIVLAEESGEFNEKEVLNTLCKKLILRHTHIFGADKASSSDEALKVWEKNKAIEKGTHTIAESMNSVAEAIPALMKANKIQKKAAKNGFDFLNVDDVTDKLCEEIGELRQSCAKDKGNIENEMGDVLFSAVNVCRLLNLEPELVLNKAVGKFVRRFNYVESEILKSGKSVVDVDSVEKDKLWKDAKEKGL